MAEDRNALPLALNGAWRQGGYAFGRTAPRALIFVDGEALTHASARGLFIVGFVGAFVDIAIVTNIQCLSKDREVGRNFSLYYFTAVLGDAVSGLVACFVFVLAGPATFLWMTLMLFIFQHT